MDPTPVFALLLKLYELRGQIVGQRSKCLELIDRCQSLERPLERLSNVSTAHSDEAFKNLKKLEKLLEKCVNVCHKFCGQGWVRSAIDVVRNPALFDNLHNELSVLSASLHLEISIYQINSQRELMEMVASMKYFIEVVGPETLKSNNLQGLMRSSLLFSEMASVEVDENRSMMKIETLILNLLSWKNDEDSELGRGGFGTVYRGKYDRAAVAVKVLSSLGGKEKLKLTREVRVMGKAQHPNVIKMLGYSIDKGLIVMELACCSLADVLAGQLTSLPGSYLQSMPEVLSCFSNVLSGLRYLHYHDIIHRDLKPQNILLALNSDSKTAGGVVAKISDFGLATMASLSASTTRNGPIGSVAYLAPELFEDIPMYSDKSDIYAVGITFNEVLTRLPPYSSGWPPAKILMHVAGGNRPTLDWAPLYQRDDEIAALIGDRDAGCLHQDPTTRPPCDILLKMIKPKLHSLLPLSFPDPNQITEQALDQIIFNSVEQMAVRSSDRLEDLASSGYAPAQNSLGVSEIKEGNLADAFNYFRLAADKSHYHPAEFNLGCCYEEGKGTEVNQETALSYFRRSAEAVFPPALYKLGSFHESQGELERALEFYRVGAELNHAPCQFKFGYLHEMMGDYAVASKYYQKAADQKFSPAQHHLAILFLNGTASLPLTSSVSSPVDAAKSLLLSCACQHFPPSHFILATRLQHNSSFHLEKAAALRYEPALLALKRPRDGSVWSEGGCIEVSQPDFPILVPLAVGTVESNPSAEDEEAKGETIQCYAIVPSGESGVDFGSSFENHLEITSPKIAQEYLYYFDHLLVCLFLCCASTIVLIVSLEEDWGESSNRRTLSNSHSPILGRSLRGHFQHVKNSPRFLDSSVNSFPRILSSSISWPSTLTVPGEILLTLCAGQSLDVSMCSSSLDSSIACSGNPLLELLDASGPITLGLNDNSCGSCPILLHTVPSSTTCGNYVLRASCRSGTCSGTALVTVTTSTCSQTFSGILSSSSNSYPVLSCSLLRNNKDSLSNIKGSSVVHGGSPRDQCELVVDDSGGSSYSSSWSSNVTNRRYYFCANEKDRLTYSRKLMENDQFYVSTFTGSSGHGTSNGVGTNAHFDDPYGVTLSSDDNYALVADYYNNMIRKIVMSTAEVSMLAGSMDGSSGYTNGVGTGVRFYFPTGVALSPDDSYALVADHSNNIIRKLVVSTSEVTLLAGSASKYSGYTNGIGTNAGFNNPSEVIISSDGRFALVADFDNHMIRKIIMSTSAVSLVAGAIPRSSGTSNGIGTNARFDYPSGICLSLDDSYALVADTWNYMIRKIVISTSEVSLLAGSADGLSGASNGIGTTASFFSVSGISLSSDDSYALIVDTANNMIRKLVMSTLAVSLIAGAEDRSYGASNGIGTSAKFWSPFGIVVSSDDSYALVGDSSSNRIRKISLFSPTGAPTAAPSLTPTISYAPTLVPSLTPTGSPSLTPTALPSLTPTLSFVPTGAPSLIPTLEPTLTPTGTPSNPPTGTPSLTPTLSFSPTETPSVTPTGAPTFTPTGSPSLSPTGAPSSTPTRAPSLIPTRSPSLTPTVAPTIFSSQAAFSPFHPNDTSTNASVSLAFIIFAAALVVSRLASKSRVPASLPSAPQKLFIAWWWVGYLCCCGISVASAVAAVASYSEALSEEPEGRYSTGFYLCLVSIFTSVGALFATPELYLLISGGLKSTSPLP